jgi:CCR4-NOT transcription complex subunit 4
MPEELRFHPSKPQNDTKFPAIDLEDLKRQFENAGGRGVSVMEQMVQDGSTMKKGAFLVDEARKYINEFVMPPATPPPHAGVAMRGQQVAHASQGANVESIVPSVEIAERQLSEAKRMADEKENALKKAIKKTKRVAGLT